VKKKRLTQQQRNQITAKLSSGATVSELASEFKVSQPTIYSIKKGGSGRAVSAVFALDSEIFAAESRITELQKAIAEIDSLREVIKIKKAALESLRKLESHK
jgi:transposase-like protein